MRPPLWPIGQSSWLQIQMSQVQSWHFQILWEVMGLERGALSLMRITEEQLERKSSGSGLENQNCTLRVWTRDINSCFLNYPELIWLKSAGIASRCCLSLQNILTPCPHITHKQLPLLSTGQYFHIHVLAILCFPH
jgi:hypothetical protein